VSSLQRERLASQANDFHGTDDSPRILLIDPLISDWIALGQFVQQRSHRGGFEFCSQLIIAWWRLAQALEESFQVKSGPTTQNGQMSAALNLCN